MTLIKYLESYCAAVVVNKKIKPAPAVQNAFLREAGDMSEQLQPRSDEEREEREERRLFEANAPVVLAPGDQVKRRLLDGDGLCLSGGGYRATLFHLGTLWRLSDAGMLRGLMRVSSVSGGSITAAWLGLRWRHLQWNLATGAAENFADQIVEPLLRLTSMTIDVTSIFMGWTPFFRTGKRVAHKYDKWLYDGATLQDLPGDDEGPRFVINATNLRSGVLWRFSRPHMADYTIGLIRAPKTPLAVAVAASAAFPPVLSPVVLRTKPSDYEPDRYGEPINKAHRKRIVLTDGGVYDNMGLETVFKKFRGVLVSDAGGGTGTWAEHAGRSWLEQFWQVFWIQRYQVGRIRRRQLVESYKRDDDDPLHRRGAYWSVGSDVRNYHLPDAMDAPFEKTQKLRDTPTRLKAMDALTQQRLINWGYAACDTAIRKHVNPAIPRPAGFPYPKAGVG